MDNKSIITTLALSLISVIANNLIRIYIPDKETLEKYVKSGLRIALAYFFPIANIFYWAFFYKIVDKYLVFNVAISMCALMANVLIDTFGGVIDTLKSNQLTLTGFQEKMAKREEQIVQTQEKLLEMIGELGKMIEMNDNRISKTVEIADRISTSMQRNSDITIDMLKELAEKKNSPPVEKSDKG